MKKIFNSILVLFGAMLIGMPSFSQVRNNNSLIKKKEIKMESQTQESNKATVRKLYEEILNSGKLEMLNEIISEEYTGIRGEKGALGFSETVNSIRIGFPNIKWKIEELIADGDKVSVRWTWKGTNTGSFRGFPASNNEVIDNAIAVYEFSGGKIIKAWIQSDKLGFLQQIGILPEDLLEIAAKPTKSRITFIDKFLVPKQSIEEFKKQMNYNREFIKTMPGYVSGEAFEQSDNDGNLTI